MHFISRGYLAVDLFFVLSGYVIALNYGSWFAEPFRLASYGNFLALRLSRIYPLHGFMLALFLLNPLSFWLFSHHGRVMNLHADYYLASFLLIQSWGFFGGPDWNVPAWSISTEWLAYLAFPVLVMAAFRLTLSRQRSIAYLLAVLAALSFTLSSYGSSTLNDANSISGMIRCIGEFSIGIGVARLDAGRRSNAHRSLALLGACACLVAFSIGAADYIVMPCAFTLLVYALADETGWLAALLHARPFQWLGVVSYSTYLSHYFLKIWSKLVFDRPFVPHSLLFPIYLVMVVGASAFLHANVEKPGQKWCRRWLASANT